MASSQPWWKAFPITQLFGVNHEQGVDIGTPFHTPITAPYGGTVTRTGCFAYGCEVDILATVPGLGTVEEYVIHLDEVASGLLAGQHVNAGALLGLSGGETQQQVNAGLFPGAQHPVQNTAKTTYSTGPHSEIGFFRGTPFASQDAGNPWPFLQNLTGTGSAGGSGGQGFQQCAAACAQSNAPGSPTFDACIASCLGGSAAGQAAGDLGASIGQGIASGFGSLGDTALHSLGFKSFPDALWRIGLVMIGIFLLLFGLATLFRKQEEQAVSVAARAA